MSLEPHNLDVIVSRGHERTGKVTFRSLACFYFLRFIFLLCADVRPYKIIERLAPLGRVQNISSGRISAASVRDLEFNSRPPCRILGDQLGLLRNYVHKVNSFLFSDEAVSSGSLDPISELIGCVKYRYGSDCRKKSQCCDAAPWSDVIAKAVETNPHRLSITSIQTSDISVKFFD